MKIIKIQKAGFIRTLEAIIAILIVFGFIIYIIPKQQTSPEIPSTLKENMLFILNEVSLNKTLRNCIISIPSANCQSTIPICVQDIKALIAKNTPPNLDFTCEICPTSTTCAAPQLPTAKSIYTDSIFIAHTTSKVFRIYFWEK